MKPFNDKILIKVDTNEYGFGDATIKREKGVVVEVPDEMIYLGFHSFSFEQSIANKDILKDVLAFYTKLKGKTVFWESLKDSGRHFKIGNDEYVLLNMTDIIGYSDDKNINVEAVDQTGSAGSFNLQ